MSQKSKPRRDWRLRVIEATQGNQTQIGVIVLASIGKEPDNPPYLRSKARIDSDGLVICDFVSKDGVYHHDAIVGDDEDLVRNVMGLVRHCDLNEDERIEFMARINNWIGTDHRDPGRIRKVMVVE